MELSEPEPTAPVTDADILGSTEVRKEGVVGEIAHGFREGILHGEEASYAGLSTNELLKVMAGALKTRVDQARTYLRRSK